MDDGTGKLDTGSFFFRKESGNIFGWIKNRARRRKTDEATALMSLIATDFRNINSKYTELNLKPELTSRQIL
jgi:hypothetical protein